MMDTEGLTGDSASFIIQSWVAFALAVVAMGWGIWVLPVDAWMRGFLAVGYLFTISSCLTLAKTIRDRHEQQRRASKLSSAAAEKILREHDQHVAAA